MPRTIPTTMPHQIVMLMGNKTIVCVPTRPSSESINVWRHGNPLKASTPLLMIQVSVISLFSQFIDLCLQPLGQSSLVSKIFGGMAFGPSLLGQNKKFAHTFFPIGGRMVIDTFANFGLMFFIFTMLVKMDPVMMLRPDRKAFTIGCSALFGTMFSSTLLAVVLKSSLAMDASLQHSLTYIAASQSLTCFADIALLLTELKIVNTDIGRLALSASMVSDFFSIALIAIGFSIMDNPRGTVLVSMFSLLSSLALVAFICVVLRRVTLKLHHQIVDAKSMNDKHMTSIFVLVLVSGFLSELVGQHYMFGPALFGLVLPDGPPLGAAITSRLESLGKGLFYPSFCTISGLQFNVFKIHFRSMWIVGTVVSFAFLVKILAVMFPAAFRFNMPTKDAFVLGLVLNTRGVIELCIYNLWKQRRVLEDQEFSLVMISLVLVTAIITPLIRALYDPSTQYVSLKRSTIQHAKHNSELRILACIHNQDNVATIIDLLEVSHATEGSPIAVIAMLLVELIGRDFPVLIQHNSQRRLMQSTSTAGCVFNAFTKYEASSQGKATVQSFTSISRYQTMHDDICSLAADKQVNIVIIPFHKQWAVDGTIGSSNRAIQNMNINVLERAPCSVGILVDRGIVRGPISVLSSRSHFRVAVLYIGGQDDMEALSYGARMVKHKNVTLAVIRFLLFGSENTKDRKRDSNLINEYRLANVGNQRFRYVEEVVMDGVGLASCIRGIDGCFDLILVGRYHPESNLLMGLQAWSECPELGVVGDILASEDSGSTTTVLVVEQQRMQQGKLRSHHFMQQIVPFGRNEAPRTSV